MSDTHPLTSVLYEPDLDITVLIIIQMTFKNDYKIKEGLPKQPEFQYFDTYYCIGGKLYCESELRPV